MQIGTLEIEDFYPYDFKFRYGGLMPFHEGIDQVLARNKDGYEKGLQSFTRFTDQLLTFPRDFDPDRPGEPCWVNDFMPFLDTVTLFGSAP